MKRNTKIETTLACLMLILSGCNSDNGTGGAAATGTSGRLFLSGGLPAAGAKIKVFPVDYIPGEAALKTAAVAYVTETDAKGEFTIDTLPRGEYNILGEKDGQVSYQDSVFISGSDGKIDPEVRIFAKCHQG